jgi:manganese/iron transport system substrate-binding protein
MMPGLSVLKTVMVCMLAMSILAAAPGYAGDKGAEHAGKMPGKMKVVTSFTIIADMARNVAGEVAVVESITKPGAEIHDYQPTPRDIVRAQNATLILWNGMNLERWFERFMKDVKGAQSIIVSEGVEPLSIYEGPYNGKPNPHAWMSTANALIYIENIRKAFVAHDPENAEIYNENARKYATQIKAVGDDVRKAMQALPEDQRYLVTSEGAFSYLARDLGMKEVYLWPINADQQGTPQQVKAVIDKVRAQNIPVVFSESTVSPKPARQVARESGALYGGVLYVDSLTEKNGPVPHYLDLLRVTTDTIIEGFKKGLEKERS